MKIMKKYILAIMLVGIASSFGVTNYAQAQTVPTIVSLPARPSAVQIKNFVQQSFISAAQANPSGTLADIQNATAQAVLAFLNAPNAVNPNGGAVTLAQALAAVNSTFPTAVLQGLTPQVVSLLNQQTVVVQAFFDKLAAANPVQPVVVNPTPVQPTVQPPAFVPPTTIVSLAARPSVAQIKIFVTQAFIAAAQANPNGTLTQVQNAAAQSVLAFLNAPNAVNPNGGTATLAQALALVTPAIAGVTNVVVPQGVTVLQTLPPQPGVPGVVTVPVFIPFSPQVLSLLNQNAAATLITSQTAATVAAQPPVVTPIVPAVPATPVSVTTPATTVTPSTLPVTTPVTPVVVQTPTVMTPVTTPAVTASGKAGNVVLNYTVVPGTTLPQFTPDQLTAIGLPQSYPFVIPAARPLSGVVTPSGGKGVQLAGPVSPIIYKLVIKAGLPFIEQSGNGIITALLPVPIEFLTTPAVQPATLPIVITPVVTVPTITPTTTTTPTATIPNGQGSGKGNAQNVIQPIVPPVVTQPVTQTAPATTTQSGNQGSGQGSNTQTVVQPVVQPAVTQPATQPAATTPATTTQSGNQGGGGGGSTSGSGQGGGSGSKGKN